MAKIRISVKGTADEARAAMQARGVSGELHAESTSPAGGSFWDVPEDELGKLGTWFCEAPSQPPPGGYPPGTLLFYR